MTLPPEFEGVQDIIHLGPYAVYPLAYEVYKPDGKLVRLERRSFQIFLVLKFSEGQNAEQIIEEVYKANLVEFSSSKFKKVEPKKMNVGLLQTHMSHLRGALGASAIINTHGYYRLNNSPA